MANVLPTDLGQFIISESNAARDDMIDLLNLYACGEIRLNAVPEKRNVCFTFCFGDGEGQFLARTVVTKPSGVQFFLPSLTVTKLPRRALLLQFFMSGLLLDEIGGWKISVELDQKRYDPEMMMSVSLT